MNKLTYFCPNCWYSQKASFTICPACNADQSIYQQDSLDKKLISAVNHPVEETRLMAVWLIGERKVINAWDTLKRRLEDSSMSFYESREILWTMNTIDPKKAYPILNEAANKHTSELIRRVALRILQREKRDF